ncbi:hypothetical protein [Streptomyces sp. NPDC046939]|uniref:hypothetical protein n=1 Tax=Streptomyces sp. NPDC046939 TaxID=3155376 RepID=UPI0033E8AEEF
MNDQARQVRPLGTTADTDWQAAIAVPAEARTGDRVLVPYGRQGPERTWFVRDDRAHAWVRDTW